MRPILKALLIAVVVVSTGPGPANAAARVHVTHPDPSTAASARPTEPTAAYWGPSTPAAPKKKPNAVRRMVHRIGIFFGSDEEIGTTPTFRDPATGRTNTGASKPYMKPLDR